MTKKEPLRLARLVLPYPAATNEFCFVFNLDLLWSIAQRSGWPMCLFFLIGCKNKLLVRSMLIDVVERITNTVKVADRGPSV
jgi:hypothetical protein